MSIKEELNEILDIGIRANASDIHLTNKIAPTLRVDGVLKVLGKIPPLTPQKLEEYSRYILKSEDAYKEYLEKSQADLSLSNGSVRFRVNICRERDADSISLRMIPSEIPNIENMNLPPVLRKLANLKNGLVLITGITGSGKSTTLASIIDEINRTQAKKILTLEDPIEFVHEHKMSIVNQREIGTDVESFASGVRSAMRQDPDIILVGEMRDLETIHNAITLAETGHLVFGTLHTKSVAETVDRMIDVFPPSQQAQIRIQIANSIEAIICQELLPKATGKGRVPALEIMLANDAIRSIIREAQNANAIVDQMQATSRSLGAQTKVQALARLVVKDLISVDVAMKGLSQGELELLNKTIVSLSRS